MGPSCCTVQDVEATYLVILIAIFVVIGVLSVYVLLKLLSGQR
jgi:hypothetical protein